MRRAVLAGILPLCAASAWAAGARSAVVPPTVEHHCASIARTRHVAVLCPRALPDGRWIVNHESLRVGRCQYLIDLETRPAGASDPFHVLAGGRGGPFPLAVRRGRWPVDVGLPRDLGLVGARPLTPGGSPNVQHVRLRLERRARVAGHAALVLLAAPYPAGGVHGGHTIVVWNQDGDGYALTMHFHAGSADGRARRAAIVLRAAATMSATPARARSTHWRPPTGRP